ncbi:hypothetical protein GCM10027176_87530 [Actinoallomurus bryophytorum]|uniref:Uncharacterized protein n=1 Tax=Actinoallomurus bryophytorum TaxID=1490222 RepID=A0A543CMI4_9ACTN|nr:hypothetical protein [Actinoallomurus bryophytorum]TQL98315.1 hypothetical protein FB559_3938 [Actinoallomurus bryophytorum]
MSNGARHTWGFFAGVVLTAALAALLIFGTYRLQHGYVAQFHKQDKWIGGGLLAGAAIVFAILAASRLSPLASLIGGIVLTAAGAVFFVSQKTNADLINRFPFKEQRVTLAGLQDEGFILFAGVGLLFASFFPSRWHAHKTDDSDSGYEYGLPESSEPYRETGGDPGYGGGARHAARDEPAAPVYGSQQGGYDPQRTSYDPLYEPTQQQQQPYGRRSSPFIPPDESGGTREMHRPE